MTNPAHLCFASLALIVLLSGCNSEKKIEIDPGPKMVVSANQSGDARYVWEQEPRRYEVTKLIQTTTTNDQQREVSVVYDTADTKAEVREAAEEVYNELWRDIRRETNAMGAADFQRIQVFVYCSREDAANGDGFHIFAAKGGGLRADALPQYDHAEYEWQWRDPAQRPDDETLKVFHEYWLAHMNVSDPDSDEEHDLVQAIAKRHSLTAREVARRVAEAWIWRNRQEVNDKRIDEQAAWFADQWKLDRSASPPTPNETDNTQDPPDDGLSAFRKQFERNSQVDGGGEEDDQ